MFNLEKKKEKTGVSSSHGSLFFNGNVHSPAMVPYRSLERIVYYCRSIVIHTYTHFGMTAERIGIGATEYTASPPGH